MNKIVATQRKAGRILEPWEYHTLTPNEMTNGNILYIIAWLMAFALSCVVGYVTMDKFAALGSFFLMVVIFVTIVDHYFTLHLTKKHGTRYFTEPPPGSSS